MRLYVKPSTLRIRSTRYGRWICPLAATPAIATHCLQRTHLDVALADTHARSLAGIPLLVVVACCFHAVSGIVPTR